MRYCHFLVIFAAFWIVPTGVVFGQDEAEDTAVYTIIHDGIERSYDFHVPADYDPDQSVPLVLLLHPAGGWGNQILTAPGIQERADQTGFMLLAPDAIDGRWDYLDIPIGEGDEVIDDVGFLVALLDQISEGYSINQDRIYVLGYSNGGVMALRLRCALTDRIAGVIAMGATMTYGLSQVCLDAAPMSSMVLLGTADEAFPWQGTAEVENGVMYSSFSMAQTVSFLISLNSCNASPSTVGVISAPGSKHEVTLYDYADCTEDVNTAFVVLRDFRHTWPYGIPIALSDDAIGDINDVFWSFFDAHVINTTEDVP